MRALGLRAFQTQLLPHCNGAEIKRLNHLPPAILRDEPLDPRPELRRLFAVTNALGRIADQDIHFCANEVEVLTNIHVWNREIQDPSSRAAWGRRRVRYFAADARHRLFAPSKFAAYIKLAASDQPAGTIIRFLTGMSLRGYDAIPYEHPIFDGGRAWQHLQDRLRYTAVPLADLPVQLVQLISAITRKSLTISSINQRNYKKKLDNGVRQAQPPRTPPPPPYADRPAVSRTTLAQAASAA